MANNTGTFFNVNDNDGIPLVGVSTDGKVMINHLYGNCLIGSTSVTGTASQPLQVTGGAYVSGNLGIGQATPLGRIHITSPGIGASKPSFGWPYYNAENDIVSKQIYIDTAGNGNVSTASSGATVSLVLGQYYDSRAVITPINAGLNSPSDQGSGHGKDLLIKGGTSDNTVKTGGRLFLSGGSGFSGGFNTNYGPVVIQPFGGNLGIGTTNPIVKLQVQGDGRFTGVVTATSFTGSLTGTASTANDVSSTININTTGIITASSFVGGLTGTASTATTALGLSTTASINTSGIITATGGFVGGLVGINTNTPPSVYKLQVHDSYIQITNAAEGTTATKGLIIGYDSSEDRQLINSFTKPLVLNTAAAGTPLVLQPTAARRVGIGSTIPTNKLDVIGDTYISGNLGIGTTNPTAKLHIDGNAFRLSTSKTPASTSDSGNKGEICWDSSYIYVCVEENTWKRSSLGSW